MGHDIRKGEDDVTQDGASPIATGERPAPDMEPGIPVPPRSGRRRAAWRDDPLPLSGPSRGGLTLPSYFSDGCVLQQGAPVLLPGRARRKARVEAWLSTQPTDEIFARTETRAGPDGRFLLEFPAFDGSATSCSLTVRSGGASVRVSDLLFGEVWVCAGQSNMAMELGETMDGGDLEAQAGRMPIRCFRPARNGLPARRAAEYPYEAGDDVAEGAWLRIGYGTGLRTGSAVGCHFARFLQPSVECPVAILDLALGATHIHAWLPRETIDAEPDIRRHLEATGNLRDRTTWNLAGDWNCNQPAALWQSKVAPLRGLAVRGILWYQGESDLPHPDYYRTALRSLADAFRKAFRCPGGEPPAFLYSLVAPHIYDLHSRNRLPAFQEALAVVHREIPGRCGLIAVHDLSPAWEGAAPAARHPIHPAEKKPVGRRFAVLAQGLVYGLKGPAGSPECSEAEIIGNKILVSFDHAGSGLRIREGTSTLRGFAVCGPDRRFVPAQAKLLYGLRVLAWNDRIPDPVAVTYGMDALVHDCTLQNREGLAALPFRTDRVASSPCRMDPWTWCDDVEGWVYPADPTYATRAPLWTAERIVPACPGSGAGPCESLLLRRDPHCRSEGDASLRLEYRIPEASTTDADPDAGLTTGIQPGCEVRFAPKLDYFSCCGPLDLSGHQAILLDLFNPDPVEKLVLEARLAFQDGSVRWLPLHLLPPRTSEPASGELARLRASARTARSMAQDLAWRTAVYFLPTADDRRGVEASASPGPDLSRVTGLTFRIRDPRRKGSGSILFDHVRWVPFPVT